MDTLQQQFIDRITDEFKKYRKSLYQLTHDEIIEKAQQIADMQYYYEAFTKEYVKPTPEQYEYLMTFEKPLEVIADKLASVDICGLYDDVEYCLWEMEDRRDIDGDTIPEPAVEAEVEM